MLTMMVKAAPRFATILCLCYVRLNACVSSRKMHTAGWAAARVVSKSIHKQCQSGLRTLAMPIGDRFSAMARFCVRREGECVWRLRACVSWRGGGRGWVWVWTHSEGENYDTAQQTAAAMVEGRWNKVGAGRVGAGDGVGGQFGLGPLSAIAHLAGTVPERGRTR